jgi:hypothetical protein
LFSGVGSNIGAPYNVFHVEHKSVEDLIRMMETANTSNASSSTPSGVLGEHANNGNSSIQLTSIDGSVMTDREHMLVEPGRPGYIVEYGDPKQPGNLEEISTKRLLDTHKNTPYYQHYFKNKRMEYL